MFKSRRNPYYYGKRRQSRNFSPLIIVASIAIALIALELIVRIGVGIAGATDELAAYRGEPEIVNSYRLNFLSQNAKPFDVLSNQGKLLMKRDLNVGYQLIGPQESLFWQINEQGFRDDDALPLEKPKDEIRIFLLGGSTAFGHWNEGNEATIAHKLEERINQRVTQQQRSPEQYRPDVFPFYEPDRVKAFALPPKIIEGNYRVINAAVPGYTSGNELAQLALKILPYEPDLIVLMDGYTDLLLPSHLEARDIP
ncbi:MAG: SGNH/GDSL hydrolase family protein, partial [Chroococcales cyanobacterium]